jgi:hypothetical protein
MRVPDYNWCKNIHNKYKISIQLINNNTYNISDIIELLSSFKLNNSIMEKCAEDKEVYNNTYISSAQKPNLLIQSIINGDIETLQIILNTEPKILENESQFYDYITQEIKLNEFLGLPYHSFKCIFHNDNSPSAGIFITKNNQYFYKCHSGCCGFMGNIIRCVERLRECNRPQAINFIKQVYKLEVKESEWQQEQKNLLKANKQMLISGEFKESHPEIYKLIQKYIPLLQIMHDIAIDNVYDKKHSDDQNNVVFFTSINKICEGLGLSKGQRGRLSDKIGLLAFLLLIKKLNEKQIPEDYLQTATELKIKNKHKSIVNFYSIPSYSDAQMIKSLERAILYVENNLTMKGWSRELLQRTFGDEIANEIYPYFQHRKPTKESQVKTEHIHKVTNELINTYGYALEKDIIYNLIVECSENNEKYSKVQLEKQIKKSLQEMLDSYGWKRVRLNNKLKEAYGIECDGYPFAIIQG